MELTTAKQILPRSAAVFCAVLVQRTHSFIHSDTSPICFGDHDFAVCIAQGTGC
jgi:hypothetical protein